MTSITRLRRLLVPALLAILTSHLLAADTTGPREHLSLDANWKFHLGDDWPNALRLDKAGASSGPASEKFNDTAWRTLNLPHDWAIELPFDMNAEIEPRLQTGRAGLSQKQRGLVPPHL